MWNGVGVRTLEPIRILAPVLAALTLAPGIGAAEVTIHPRRHADAYILARGDHFWSTNCSIQDLHNMRRKLSGTFLWFRRAGDAYVIRDPATLEAAWSLFAPLDALEPERAELRARQQRLEEKERALEKEEAALDRIGDRLSDADEDGPKGRDVENKKRALEERQRELEALQRPEDERDRALDEREEAIERKAEAELWRLLDRAINQGIAQQAR
jgi:DNA repair exonuclease SbcCD ATPase subunit